MKIIISGGKTGGHLIPGIAIYEEILRRQFKACYIMSAFDLKFPVVKKVKKDDRVLLNLQNISRKLSWKTPFYLLKIFLSLFQIFGLIRKYKPDAIIITGGYISNPVALSAVLLRIPLFIAEQNSVSGVTNRFYAPFAKKIFINFPETLKVPAHKTILVGNPSIHTKKTAQSSSKKYFHLSSYKKVVGISGGSQGSKAVNDRILDLLPYFRENKIGVIWSLGSVDYNRLKNEGKLAAIKKSYPNVLVFQFIERMDLFFCCSDLIISRSGATSISEIIHFEAPSLLIPIKNSPDNHQYSNANFIRKESCGMMIEENELSVPKMRNSIEKLLAKNPYYRKNLKRLNQKYYRQAPEKIILDEVLRSMAF